MNSDGKDESIDIADIKSIRVVKKSKYETGALIGGLIGGGGGTLIGYAMGDSPPGWGSPTAEVKALSLGLSFGFLGLLIGAGIGAVAGKDKTIQIEGISDSEIQETLDKLRNKARIRDYK